MRFATIFLTIITFMLAGYTWMRVRQQSETPDIRVIGGGVYDAGVVSANKTIVHRFKIINPHSFPVLLSTPDVGCSCTTALASAPVIPANGTATVTLSIEPEVGNLSGSVSILTEHNRLKSETWLFVKGKVTASVGA